MTEHFNSILLLSDLDDITVSAYTCTRKRTMLPWYSPDPQDPDTEQSAESLFAALPRIVPLALSHALHHATQNQHS